MDEQDESPRAKLTSTPPIASKRNLEEYLRRFWHLAIRRVEVSISSAYLPDNEVNRVGSNEVIVRFLYFN